MKIKITFKKLAKFVQMLRIPNNTFKPTLVKKFSKIALPILLYGGEICTLRK